MLDPDDPSAIAPGVKLAAGGYRLQYSRSAGPGGQNVNKVNSKAELWVAVEALIGLSFRAKARLRDLAGSRLTLADEIHLRSEEERSQEYNRRAVFERLRELVLQARSEPKVRHKTKPTRASHRRRVEGKRHRGQIKAARRGPTE